MTDVVEALSRRAAALSGALDEFTRKSADDLRAAADLLSNAVAAKRTVFVCGNGGSAAHAMHLEAELLGRYRTDRDPLPALYLGASASTATAVGNDYGFDEAFARTLRALGREGDLVVALSTSGASPNVLAALAAARDLGIGTILLAGRDPKAAADVVLKYPADGADAVQDGHQLLVHALMDQVEPPPE